MLTLKMALVGLLLVFIVGCVKLTEEQRNDVSKANQDIVRLESHVGNLITLSDDLVDAIKAVVEKVAAGEMPKEEGEKLLAFYKQKRDVVAADIKAATGEVQSVKKTIEAISAAGVPWYQQLWLLLPGILAGGAAALNRHAKFRGAAKVAGVFSRAGDMVKGFGAAVHTEAKASGVPIHRTDAMWNEASNGRI